MKNAVKASTPSRRRARRDKSEGGQTSLSSAPDPDPMATVVVVEIEGESVTK